MLVQARSVRSGINNYRDEPTRGGSILECYLRLEVQSTVKGTDLFMISIRISIVPQVAP